MNLKKKLLGMFIVLLIIPGLVISIFGYFNSKTGLEELTEKGLKNSVRLATELIHVHNQLVEEDILTLEEAQEAVKQQLIGEKTNDQTRKIEGNYEFGENGYFVVFDEKGNTIAHPTIEGENVWDESYNGTHFIQEMIQAAQEGDGFTYYDFPMPNDPDDVKEKVTYTEIAPHWNWIIGVNAYTHEYNNHTHSLLINSTITLIITVVIGLLFGNFFANYVSNPINEIMRQAQHISKGKLSIPLLNIENNDELGVLAQSFNEMLVNLQKMIGQTSDTSYQVSSTTEELSVGSEQTNEAIEQISASIQEVVNDAELQSSNANELVKVTNEIVETIEQVISQVNIVTLASDQTIDTATSGNQIVEKAGEQMNMLNESTDALKQSVHELSDHSTQIGDILSLITNISEQTNLLALNATIEAARAGEYGEGFAVVANEIRELAEQSAVATDDIQGLIEEIQKSIEHAVHSMDENESAITDGITLTREAGVAFGDISEAINRVSNEIYEITKDMQTMDDNTVRLTESSASTEKISAATVSYTETVAAAIEEHTATMQEVTLAIQNLAEMAEELQKSVDQFNL